jgi:hypothetical protein
VRQLTLIGMLLVAFLFAFARRDSYLHDAASMVGFFRPDGGTPSTLGDVWPWTIAPFKYRLLFHFAIDRLADAIAAVRPHDPPASVYFLALGTVSAASFVLAGLALARLLRVLGFRSLDQSLGVALFLLLPAVHNAYVYPTCTKEDFLAYAIFWEGLTALLGGASNRFVLLTLLGAATRETLLILPLLGLLRADTRRKAAIGLALAIGIQIAIRYFMGLERYAVLKIGLLFNAAHPLTSLLGAFLVLGGTWVPIVAYAKRAGRVGGSEAPALAARATFARWFLPVALLLFLNQFLLGRMNEIRISFLLAPWGIAATLLILRRLAASHLLAPRTLVVPAAFLSLVVLVEVAGFGARVRSALNPHFKNLTATAWWAEIYLQATFTLYLAGCVRRDPPADDRTESTAT